MLRIWLSLYLIGFSLIAVAGPGPFGLEIDESKFTDLNKKYTLTYSQSVEVENTSYTAYNLGEIQPLDFKGLNSVLLYFDKNTGVLKCVILNIHATRYEAIESMLSSKYRNVERANTPLSDKHSIFVKDRTIIKLDAPVLSGLMRLIYINQDIYTSLTRNKTKSPQELRKEEAAKL